MKMLKSITTIAFTFLTFGSLLALCVTHGNYGS
jgi:hypothetical protein